MIILCFVIFLGIKKYHKSEEESSFFSWSTGDCNGVYTISGMRTKCAIDTLTKAKVYPIDSLDNNEYFGLKYPAQSENIVYYTTTSVKTGKDCIIAKINQEPDWTVFTDEKTGAENKYYRKNNNWNFVLSQDGEITYKCIAGNKLYYVLKYNSSNDIHCFDLQNKTDEIIITNIHEKASFDVNTDGSILYVTENNQITLHNTENQENYFGIGKTACFWNHENILLVNDSGVYTSSFTGENKHKLCNASGYDVKLSASGTYIALQDSYENTFGSGMEQDKICIIDISTGRTQELTAIPNVICGFAWLCNYFPIA